MDKIKVLQIGGNLQKNGITTYLLDSFKELSEKFIFIFINTSYKRPNEDVESKIILLGGKIYNIPYKENPIDIETELREIIRAEKVDVIHSHYFFSNGFFMKLAFEEEVPIRISHCHNDKSGYLSLEESEILEDSRILIEKYATKKLAVTKKSGVFLYGNNDFEINRMILDLSKFFEIENKTELFRKYFLDTNQKYSIFVGRLSFQKNIFFLIEIAKKILNRRIIIVGDGPLKLDFNDAIKKNKLEDKFVFLDDKNLNEVYNLADTLLLPSLYEGLSLTLLEANKAGLVCLLSYNLDVEVSLDNVLHLELESNIWADKLNDIEKQKKSKLRSAIDIEKSVKDLLEIYTDNYRLSDIYVDRGRKFALGSELGYQSPEKSSMYYLKAHNLGNIRGTFYLALMYFEGSGVEKNIPYANILVKPIISEIEKLSQKEEHRYLTILADMYSFGLGKKKDFKKAFEIYHKAASLGNLEAMCDLGYMYLVGQGVEKNLELSFEYFKKSADLGYLHSMRDVALLYIEGIGIEKDYCLAIEWLEKASKLNYAHATTDLAWIYYENKSYRNIEKAIQLFLLGIEQDKNRALRDLVAHSIDIKNLVENKKIVLFDKTELLSSGDIDENILIGSTIVINKNILKIEPNIFFNHPNIRKFFVENDNPNFCSIAGVLYTKDKTKIVRFPLGSSEKIFVIPEFVDTIGNSAFDDCKYLEEIKINDNVKRIEKWAFHGCDRIKVFSLPKTIIEIGEYAFGSCESLLDIEVSFENPKYSSFENCLFNKDLSILMQYPIGSKMEIYRVPKNVSIIAFRAFSDAFNLTYVDAANVSEIDEKAFYYCTKLKEIVLNEACQLNGKKIFDQTDKTFRITRRSNGRVILIADIHGHMRLDYFKNVIARQKITFKDIVIILGDAGILWSEKINEEVKSFYSNLQFTILFLDGNHENFDVLEDFEIVIKFGSNVHKILDNVFHLIRGNSYIINGHKFFVFGGAYSIKRDYNDSKIKTWVKELPNELEMDYGNINIDVNNSNFDYLITHQGPKTFLDEIDYIYSKNELPFLEYLETIKMRITFKKWFFGHIHQDLTIGNISSIYNREVVINGDD